MRRTDPCQVTCHEGKEFVVSVAGVREAITRASDRPEALEPAEGALLAGLTACVDRRMAVPVPNPVLEAGAVRFDHGPLERS